MWRWWTANAPQHSIHGLRERELKLIEESLYFKALACDHFRKIKKHAYPIVESDAVNALDDAEKLLANEEVKPMWCSSTCPAR